MRSFRIVYILLIAILFCSVATAATKKAEAEAKKADTDTKKTDKDVPLRTAFKLDPLKVLQSDLLQTEEAKQPSSDAEMDLLQHARHNTMDQISMAKAALIISGVIDEDEQKHYMDQLADIANECKKLTDAESSQLAKAKVLAKYLHEVPMHGGYETQQYNMKVLLETGHYNCVSSAVLYNMMAKHCGIEVRAVTRAGHVFSRALDFDIEPTAGRVYSNADRDDRVLKAIAAKENKNSAYVNQLYRETSNLGLLSTMYQDMGGAFGHDEHYEECVATYLKAACLDPKDPSTLGNLRAYLKRWSALCKKNHDDSKAKAVDKFADELLREPGAPNRTSAL